MNSISAAALEYPFAKAPIEEEWIAVAPGVFWVRMPLPFALDHINLWMVEDGPGYAIIDTGLFTERIVALWDIIIARLIKPVTRIILTHYHPDHLGCAVHLANKMDVQIWMTLGEYLTAHAIVQEAPGYRVNDWVALFKRHGLNDEACEALTQRGNAYARGVSGVPSQIRRLIEGDVLRIGEHDWRIIAGYGHAVEHAALYCDALKVLIAGDMLLPRISSNVNVAPICPEEDAVTRFISSLHKFLQCDAQACVLPAHGMPFIGIANRVQALEAHHAERCAELLQWLTHPLHAGELLPKMFVRTLDTHQTFFAMGEAIAHLNHLWQTAEVDRLEDDVCIRYVRKAS